MNGWPGRVNLEYGKVKSLGDMEGVEGLEGDCVNEFIFSARKFMF